MHKLLSFLALFIIETKTTDLRVEISSVIILIICFFLCFYAYFKGQH